MKEYARFWNFVLENQFNTIMGSTSKSLEDSSAENNAEYGVLKRFQREQSETKNVAVFWTCPKNLPGLNLKAMN